VKFLEEYRDPEKARSLARQIESVVTEEWRIMEICGGQTHAILEYGIDRLLPASVDLIHGPGCPVCVTPISKIDKALKLAQRPEVIFCSFGDMLRVPGSEGDLRSIRSRGGDVRIVYSPLNAVEIARENPDHEVVFFAIGFETTAPVNAQAIRRAEAEGLDNFSLLVSQVLVPPAIRAIKEAEDCRVDGFLAAGHVCTVMGYWQYEPLAEDYETPIVVTGFEPFDLLQGLHICLKQLEAGQAEVMNQYSRAVTREGTKAAQEQIEKIFKVVNQQWRGLGEIPNSGLALKGKYNKFNAEEKFEITVEEAKIPDQCICGQILQGLVRPSECPAFGRQCTPDSPLGACMVSSEGACAAYYRYS